MALIYRTIVDVEDHGFIDRAPALFGNWVDRKVQGHIDLKPGETHTIDDPRVEVHCKAGRDANAEIYQIEVFEDRPDAGEQVRSTLTALQCDGRACAWIDVARWVTESDSGTWLPHPPQVVRALLEGETCHRGPTALDGRVAEIGNANAQLLASAVLDPTRELPLVVVTVERNEPDHVAAARAEHINRRLLGVASVALLRRDGTTEFSRTMLGAVGPDMDVHSGFIRTYAPGVGGERDHPRRHRYVPHWRVTDRIDSAAYLVAPPILRRASEQAPPSGWRKYGRRLVAEGDPEIIEIYEATNIELETEVAALRAHREQILEQLGDEQISLVEALSKVEALGRQVSFMRGRLVEMKDPEAYTEVPADDFEPLYCSEVLAEGRSRLELVELPPSLDDEAAALDVHNDFSWAAKAWAALLAFETYARGKRDGTAKGDFKIYCRNNGDQVAISEKWIGLHESELTKSNPRFRALRTLPVSTDVDPSGTIFMEAHIRLQAGGTPAPRIYYHDDTAGRTGKIHVGWFGDHLDSSAKS